VAARISLPSLQQAAAAAAAAAYQHDCLHCTYLDHNQLKPKQHSIPNLLRASA
jgi:hypothetical protein